MKVAGLLVMALVVFIACEETRVAPATDERPTTARTSEGKALQPAVRSVEGRGALVIVGGGELPDAIRERFLELGGGKKARLVVIPTASARDDRVARGLQFWKANGPASVVMLDTLNPAEANNALFVKPLREATAVWLSGGDQSRLVNAYRGTLVERELQTLLARGGVIGGTSAGASAMSAVMIRGGNPRPTIGAGFGFLPGVVIDQHFQNRSRLPRLLNALAVHPNCLGLGIDEQTAVVVRGRSVTVLGNANVRLCFAQGNAPAVRVLKAEQVVDLSQHVRPREPFAGFSRAGEASRLLRQ
jgi:cyanophycinase